MTLEYIRKKYKVPAKLGAKVTYWGKEAEIVGELGHYLMILVEGREKPIAAHPTFQMEYHEANKEDKE